MAENPHQPGPGRSTADAAVNELKKEIAKRNEAAHRAEREMRGPREQMLAEKRRRDSLR
ncbi:MAG: hypothetical protein QOI91_1649 [Solirubrobacteraceae bacterium]|jgi:hypothetical protein|nr:hypothetical protein [Solirubrobacteraceae bacterium]